MLCLGYLFDILALLSMCASNIMKFEDLKDVTKYPEIGTKVHTVNGKKFTVVSYLYSTHEMWNKHPLITECRGITFDENGTCVCRPFHKFFNLNENAMSSEDSFDFSKLTVMDKLDGSMITPVLVNDDVIFKTKKSFISDVANEANKNMTKEMSDFCKSLLLLDITPIFEFIHEDHGIVINYKNKKTMFNLLALRSIQTGEYIDIDNVSVDHIDELSIVEFFEYDLEQMLEFKSSMTGVEGFVFKDKNGKYCKIKTDWYNTRHRLTQYTPRTIGDLIVNQEIDDVLPLLNSEQLKSYKIVENDVNNALHKTINDIKELVDIRENDFDNDKDFYVEMRGTKLLPWVSSYRKNQLDIVKLWKTFHRSSFDCSQNIFWLQPSEKVFS